MPVGNLIETNSGSPLGPEYVFYHSRYQRTSIFINFARALSEDFAFSLGTIVGFQASADVQAELALNGSTTYGSSSTARSKVAPSIGLITSATKKIDEHKIYFTYQQEMKSNLHAHAAGQVTGPFTIPFDTNIDSVIFYDPHTFRIGGAYKLNNSELFAALEYQLWSNYKTPTIVITKTTSLTQPSRNYENISTRNTINPRIGIKNNLTDRWSCSLGFNYHQSPLDSNFSSSGNSIDTDTFIYTAGLQYRMVIWSKDVHLGTSFEYHKLFSKEVNKSANEENGSAGNKIGAPGYKIGGKVLASTFGIKFNF
jgi:long-subunit fatty acid transport protein